MLNNTDKRLKNFYAYFDEKYKDLITLFINDAQKRTKKTIENYLGENYLINSINTNCSLDDEKQFYLVINYFKRKIRLLENQANNITDMIKIYKEEKLNYKYQQFDLKSIHEQLAIIPYKLRMVMLDDLCRESKENLILIHGKNLDNPEINLLSREYKSAYFSIIQKILKKYSSLLKTVGEDASFEELYDYYMNSYVFRRNKIKNTIYDYIIDCDYDLFDTILANLSPEKDELLKYVLGINYKTKIEKVKVDTQTANRFNYLIFELRKEYKELVACQKKR